MQNNGTAWGISALVFVLAAVALLLAGDWLLALAALVLAGIAMLFSRASGQALSASPARGPDALLDDDDDFGGRPVR